MNLTLPPTIAALDGITEADVPVLNAWAKSVHPDIAITWDNERVAPPRRPGRGESIEQIRARDPGPSCLTVRCVEKRTNQRSMRRVAIHKAPPRAETAILARVELTVLLEQQQAKLKAHKLSLAVAESKDPWDYPEATANHHDLMGQLCAESIADPEYVAHEARLHELREIIKGDWRSSLVEAVSSALRLSTVTEGAGRNRQVLVHAARERAALAQVSASSPK